MVCPARIYVAAQLRHLESVEVGGRTWWCVERDAEPGELGVLYVKMEGLSLVFRLLGRAAERQFFCSEFKLATGDIEVVGKAAEPISVRTLRNHPVLRKLPAVSRNFQRRSFRLSEPFLSEVLALIGGPSSARK